MRFAAGGAINRFDVALSNRYKKGTAMEHATNS